MTDADLDFYVNAAYKAALKRGKMEIPFKLPVTAFVRGYQFELRDPQNRTVFMFQVLKGDINYTTLMKKQIEFLAKLLNGEVAIKKGENGFNVIEHEIKETMTVRVPMAVSEGEITAPEKNGVPPEPVEVKKKRGRPFGWKKK